MPARTCTTWLLTLLCCLSLASAQTQSAPQYLYNQASFPVGQYPTSVAIADLNNDGRPDLIAVNAIDDSLSILLGRNDATFAPKVDVSLPLGPKVVVAGDFNQDGKEDLAVLFPHEIDILLGNGDGTLRAPVAYPAGSIFLLQLADLNHDGIPDLIAAGFANGSSAIQVFLGVGDGSFHSAVTVPVSGTIENFTVADLNGDGAPDLAISLNQTADQPANQPGTVAVLLNKGDGSFGAPLNLASGHNIAGIAAGDVTGDTIPDLIVSHVSEGLTLLQGKGDGTFQPDVTVSSDRSLTSQYLQLPDLNGDGKADLLLSSGQGIVVLLGNGDGSFQPPAAYRTGLESYVFTTGDVNGDGHTDLAIVDHLSNSVAVLLGNGDGTLNPRMDLLHSLSISTSSTTGDLNADGLADIVILTAGQLEVFLGTPHGIAQTPLTSPFASTLSSNADLRIADLNQDGHNDLLVGGVLLLPGKGDGTFGAPVKLNTDNFIRDFITGDFNNDGLPDILEVGNGFFETPPLQLLLNKGNGSFQALPRFWTLSSIPEKVATGDFNHDGKLDVALTLNPNGVAILLGDGNGGFAPPTVLPTDDLPKGLTVADVNGDGLADLVATGSAVDVFLGHGDGTFAARVDYPIDGFPDQISVGDLNNDGFPDLIVTENFGQLGILLGKGDGTFQTPLLFASNGQAPLSVTDLNGDHVPDILAADTLFLSTPVTTISPALLDFGTVVLGATTPPLNITVTNSGNSPLSIAALTSAAPFSVTGTVCTSPLSRLATCQIPVSYMPSATGRQTGSLTLSSTSSPEPIHVALTGSAVVPMLTFTPASLSFPAVTVGTTSAPQSLTLSNSSGVDIQLGSIAATGPFATTSTCGATLANNSTCTVMVTYTPTGLGQQTGTITITDDAAGSPQQVALSGSGVAPLTLGLPSGSSATADVAAGSSASFALTLSIAPGLAGTAAIHCTGAPANAACTVSPASVPVSSTGGTSSLTVTVTTTQQSAQLPPHISTGVQFAGFTALIGVLLLPGSRRHLKVPAALLFCLLTLVSLSGCSSATKSQAPTVTPGTYTLVITAKLGDTVASQNLTLNVH